MSASCRICKAPLPAQSPFGPFCSPRCRGIDLGAWASEKYRIPSTTPSAETQAGEASSEPELHDAKRSGNNLQPIYKH